MAQNTPCFAIDNEFYEENFKIIELLIKKNSNFQKQYLYENDSSNFLLSFLFYFANKNIIDACSMALNSKLR